MSVHACPKPPAETDAEKRHRKIEAARKLERSRRVPLPRSSKSVQRTKPLPKKNARRSKANHERAYGEHARWIRTLPCVACGHRGSTEAAHTTTGGMGRKADANTLVPLCGPYVEWADPRPVTHEGCHRELHARGIKTFEAKYGLSLAFHAARLWTAGGKE